MWYAAAIGSVASVSSTSSRSEERRVGEECRYRWGPDYLKKKKDNCVINIAVKNTVIKICIAVVTTLIHHLMYIPTSICNNIQFITAGFDVGLAYMLQRSCHD